MRRQLEAVAKKLDKASKAHAGQAKTLRKLIKKNGR
jgi:hypothetical protein